MNKFWPRFRPLMLFLGTVALLVKPSFAKEKQKDFEDVAQIPWVQVDLRYSTANNFMGENLYGTFHTAYLHRIASAKLRKATVLLQKRKPGWTLLVFDALRPRDVQQQLWNKVKGTESQIYVADPKKGSVHNYGFAVDVSLRDEKGTEIDMGTPFDSFEPLAQPKKEDMFLHQGKLTSAQIFHRHLLRDVMETAGFRQLPLEWWHFDALPKEEVKARYSIVETWHSLTQ
ncbi:MAG: M15 family metallopeptidase [Elusimicrobia bacterium]|nr:M15 family metallopeptidase [Elusimicrobiota bacterium]